MAYCFGGGPFAKRMSMTLTHVSDTDIGDTAAIVSAPQSVPRGARLFVGGIELSLVAILAYFIVQMFYGAITPQPNLSASFRAIEAVNSIQGPIQYQKIVSFDPFYRQLSAQNAPRQIAPETKLKITVAGLRVGPDGSGSAIIASQGSDQKLVLVGDEISPGVFLSRLYPDRIEITQRGLRETVYMTKPDNGTRGAVYKNNRQSDSIQTGGFDVSDLFSKFTLGPVRRGNRLVGFRVMEGSDTNSLAQTGLEVEDVILSVNGAPLTSFERVQELGEELSGAKELIVELERRGERLTISL
jgi:general secretion pathway protein C